MHSDWFKQCACFTRVQSTEFTNAHAIRQVCFENKDKFAREIIDFFIINKTNKKASTVLSQEAERALKKYTCL